MLAGAWASPSLPPFLCRWDGGKRPSQAPWMPLGTLLCRWKQERSPPEPRRGGTGCFEQGLLFAQMRRVLSHLAACRPAPPRGSICGAAPAKPVNHTHIKAPAARALTTRAAGSERSVPAQMFSSSFSQLQTAAEFTRKPRKGKESWPAEGPQQRAHASLAASRAGSDQHITTSLHFSIRITLPCVSLQPSLWGSPAPIKILVFFRKTPPCGASWA